MRSPSPRFGVAAAHPAPSLPPLIASLWTSCHTARVSCDLPPSPPLGGGATIGTPHRWGTVLPAGRGLDLPLLSILVGGGVRVPKPSPLPALCPSLPQGKVRGGARRQSLGPLQHKALVLWQRSAIEPPTTPAPYVARWLPQMSATPSLGLEGATLPLAAAFSAAASSTPTRSAQDSMPSSTCGAGLVGDASPHSPRHPKGPAMAARETTASVAATLTALRCKAAAVRFGGGSQPPASPMPPEWPPSRGVGKASGQPHRRARHPDAPDGKRVPTAVPLPHCS